MWCSIEGAGGWRERREGGESLWIFVQGRRGDTHCAFVNCWDASSLEALAGEWRNCHLEGCTKAPGIGVLSMGPHTQESTRRPLRRAGARCNHTLITHTFPLGVPIQRVESGATGEPHRVRVVYFREAQARRKRPVHTKKESVSGDIHLRYRLEICTMSRRPVTHKHSGILEAQHFEKQAGFRKNLHTRTNCAKMGYFLIDPSV